MLLLFEKDKAQLAYWSELRANINNLQATIADQTHALLVVNAQIDQIKPQLASNRVFIDNALKDQLTRQEIALTDTKQNYQADAPEVKDLESQIASARAKIERGGSPVVIRNTQNIRDSYEQLRARKEGIEATLAGARASLVVRQGEYARLRSLLDKIPERMQINHEFERRQMILDAKYKSLNEKLTMAAVSMVTAKSAPSSLNVVEYASPPEKPTWPNTKLMLLAALVLGLLLGMLGALLVELVFLRVNRTRLLRKEDSYNLLAIVDSDPHFLGTVFAPQPSAE
jgi:uncharacterized protein involved in exopolysaccharide biosynthesis